MTIQQTRKIYVKIITCDHIESERQFINRVQFIIKISAYSLSKKQSKRNKRKIVHIVTKRNYYMKNRRNYI